MRCPTVLPMTALTGRSTAIVRAAFWCWLVVIVVDLLLGALLALGAGSASMTGTSDIEGMSTGALTATGVFLVVVGLVQLWVAVRMWRGANWARVVLTVLGIIGVASMWGQGETGSLDWILVAATVVAVVLMWIPPAGDHFRAAGTHRKAAQ